MHKNTALRMAGLLLLACLALAAAVGAAGDPLISRSYLEGDFFQSLETEASLRLDRSDEALRSSVSGLPETTEIRERTLKKGDVLSGGTGLSVTLLGGQVRWSASGGGLVDVTEGREVPSGELLRTGHRYIAAEETAAEFTAVTAAVLSCQGGGTVDPSQAPDPFAQARALRALGLFRGTGSGFAEGFDLHLAPTRGEGLVLFLRLLGEEEQALAGTGTHPFTDVPGWLDRYVAWAYGRGYVNGVAADRFGSGQAMSAVEYMELLLRALGYSRAGVDDYATSLERALNCGAVTGEQYAALRDEAFLRSHAVSLSWAVLDVPLGGGTETLAQRLAAAGVFTEEQLASARELADPEHHLQIPA